jgi:hypothetical protein
MRQLGGSMTITSGLTGTVVHAQMPFVSDVQALAGTYNGRGASKAPITQVAVA